MRNGPYPITRIAMSRLSSNVTRSLTLRYVLALVAIGATCLASQFVIQSLLASAERHSHVINLAGRQRMLSQRISKLAHRFAADQQLTADQRLDRTALASELEQSVREFREAGLALRAQDSGHGAMVGLEARQQLTKISPSFDSISTAAVELVSLAHSSQPSPAEVRALAQTIQGAEAEFLVGMEQVVATIAEHSSAHIRKLIGIEQTITVTTLVLLLLEALYVFRPAVKRISDAIRSLSLALTRARSEHEAAQAAISERNVALTAAASDLDRLSHEIDALLADQAQLGAKHDLSRFRMLMTHVQSTLGKLTNLTDGTPDTDDQLLVSRTSPRSLVQDAVHRFRRQTIDEASVEITTDDRLPASLLVDEQLFRDSLIYLLQSVFDASGPELAVHVGYDDREIHLFVHISPRSSQTAARHSFIGDALFQGREVQGREVQGREVQGREVQGREVQGRNALASRTVDSLDLLLARRTLERLGGEIKTSLRGSQVTALLPLDETKRMNLFVDRDAFQVA
jgi:hypothetical protein